MRISVEYLGDSAEVFLTSSVPNLQFYSFVINLDCVLIEFDTDRHLAIDEFILHETLDCRRFPTAYTNNDHCQHLTLVADEDNFEKMVEILSILVLDMLSTNAVKHARLPTQELFV